MATVSDMPVHRHRSIESRPFGRVRRVAIIALVITAMAGAACASDDEGPREATASTTTTIAATGEVQAQVASYDLVANAPQRILIGLVASEGRVVTGGEIDVFFAHLGEGTAQSATGTLGEPNRGVFQQVSGAQPPSRTPRISRPSEAVGVYVVRGAVFDKPGRWGLLAEIDLAGESTQVQAVFEVGSTSGVLRVGDTAPTTRNPQPGAPELPPEAIDSRAQDGEPVPDSALHDGTIADALAAGRPTVVVVSTPVYCLSQFCGPITDTVEALAAEYDGQAAFVHLEVWQDFEKKQVNPAAGEWIYRRNAGDLSEPWVFVVGRDGKVAERFDNIAGEEEIRAAIDRVLV